MTRKHHPAGGSERSRLDRFSRVSPLLLGILGPEGRLEEVNPAWECMLGQLRHGEVGLPLTKLVHPYDEAMVIDALRRASAGHPAHFLASSRCADGTYRTLDWQVEQDPDSAFFYAQARVPSEGGQSQVVAVLDGLEAAVFVADARTDEVLFANRAFLKDHGPDAVGHTLRGSAVPQPERGDYRIDPRKLTSADLPQELFDGELQDPLSGRWYYVREQATRWVDGRVVRMGIATDITDRKRVEAEARDQEERMAQTSRLITMGEMASTLAHELNQPLAAVANYCMGCVTRLEAGGAQHADLLVAMKKASAQAERAGKIIRRIRDFVRKSEPHRVPVALADVMEDALGIAEIEARKAGVRLTVALPADLPWVMADRIMVEQVILNLVRNGVEAMADTPPDQRELAVRAAPLDGGMVRVSVQDRGHGIEGEDLERLFKPFFTTKADGMGMGLNICRSIIEFHGGRLWAESPPQGGTHFHFTLPMETASEPPADQL